MTFSSLPTISYAARVLYVRKKVDPDV